MSLDPAGGLAPDTQRPAFFVARGGNPTSMLHTMVTIMCCTKRHICTIIVMLAMLNAVSKFISCLSLLFCFNGYFCAVFLHCVV